MENYFEQERPVVPAKDTLTKAGMDCEAPCSCDSVFYQSDIVSVPVKVIPYGRAGKPVTISCGTPIVTQGRCVQGEPDQVCEFTVSQKICVELPLHFGAKIAVDCARIQCGCISEGDYDRSQM